LNPGANVWNNNTVGQLYLGQFILYYSTGVVENFSSNYGTGSWISDLLFPSLDYLFG
jgi:hypothetical protein